MIRQAWPSKYQGDNFGGNYTPHINKAMDDADKQFSGIDNKTIQLPPATLKPVEGTPAEQSEKIPAEIESAYKAIMKYLAEIKSAAIESPPNPPSIGFDYCYPCDKQRQATYVQDSIKFMKYIEREQENVAACIHVIHLFDLMHSDDRPYDNKRGEAMVSDMHDGIPVILDRIGKKLTLAWTTYRNDATKIPFLTSQLVSYIRSNQLMGHDPVAGFPEFSDIATQSVTAAKAYLSDALSRNDYKILLNARWIVSIYRMAELLGMGKEKTDKDLMDFININRFKVSVDVTATLTAKGTVRTASMKGNNFFRAVPDSNCVLQWTLTEPDDAEMQFDLRHASLQVPYGIPIYTGTRKWKSYPAYLKLDFCKEERDTAVLFQFQPSEGSETWMVRTTTLPAMVITPTLTEGFMDIERMQRTSLNQALQARLQQEVTEKLAKLKAASTKDPASMTPEELERYNAATVELKAVNQEIQATFALGFLFKGKLKNYQKTIFDETLNGRQLFPQNRAITEAIFHLTIEHASD
jgi:hypothetical protein